MLNCGKNRIFKATISFILFLIVPFCAYATDVDIEPVPFDEEAYIQGINDAYRRAYIKEPCIFPTLLKQNTYRPNHSINDSFGKNEDTTPIFRVMVNGDKARENAISISFDSAYINKYTYQILDVLDKYNVKATFFMTYEFMLANKSQIIEIVKRGHEIGNHTTTHPDLNLVDDFTVVYEVMKCHNLMKSYTGIDMCLFRFPYGSYSPRTVSILKRLGYYPIQWTFDTVDWKNEPIEILIRRFNESEFIIPGSIILCHNGATYTPEALPSLIEIVRGKGLEFMKVSDLIFKHDFKLNNGKQYSNHVKYSDKDFK